MVPAWTYGCSPLLLRRPAGGVLKGPSQVTGDRRRVWLGRRSLYRRPVGGALTRDGAALPRHGGRIPRASGSGPSAGLRAGMGPLGTPLPAGERPEVEEIESAGEEAARLVIQEPGKMQIDLIIEGCSFGAKMEEMFEEDFADSREVRLGGTARRPKAEPERRIAPAQRRVLHGSGGSGSRAVVTAARAGATAFRGGGEVLQQYERTVGVAVSASLLGTALLGARFPRLLAWPLAVAAGLVGVSGLLRTLWHPAGPEGVPGRWRPVAPAMKKRQIASLDSLPLTRRTRCAGRSRRGERECGSCRPPACRKR